MQAVILAAGMGKRLKHLTANNTKCMIKVNGETLIQRMLHQLDANNLSRIIIVVGYKEKELKDYLQTLRIKTPIEYVCNPVYDKTNNIYSLFLAKDFLSLEDTLLLESDLIFEDSVLSELVNDPRDTLALVDKYESWMDGTCVKLDENDSIEAFIPGTRFKFDEINNYYKTVNIYKFSKHFSEHFYVPFLEAYSRALGNNEYYEQVLRVITMLDEPVIKAKRLKGQLWYEIDDAQDLDIAESIFSPNPENRVRMLQERYGGYWRYPGMLDFCYLVNPYFPPQRMMDEMKASFEKLLTQYPSGQRVLSLLAAKLFDTRIENIIVGNGAAELIKLLMESSQGNTGIIRPTFEEYSNRYEKERLVVYYPENPDFGYSADDIINYFADKLLRNLILINPDNPSGNYIPKSGIIALAKWTQSKNITFVVDESFVDFAEEEGNSLICQELLQEYPNIVVVKSISKSYGVPGLRLGVLASGNMKLISEVKQATAIWNINSLAEFFLQIEEKYRKDYRSSLQLLVEERKRVFEELRHVSGLRVIPSQANYFMLEITNGMTSRYVAHELLQKNNMLIKDLSSKVKKGEYVRVAIRNKTDNDCLIHALRELMGC